MSRSFKDLGVSAPVVDALAARGITAPFQIQNLVLPNALDERDILAKSPTGSGKTLAFGIPVVELTEADDGAGAVVILVPTRELATQVTEELDAIATARGLSVTAVYGGVPLPAQAKRAAKAHILVATPGRLTDLVSRKLISLKNVHTLVLDEADRMLDMGFQPQVDRIVKMLPKDRQTMFFSATLDGEVGLLARAYTDEPAYVEADLPDDKRAGDVEHRFIPVTAENKLETLVKEIFAAEGLVLVFVRTKRGADRLAERLVKHDIDAVAMHGDLSQGQRERALKRFESGKVSTLVATDVAARGLDLDDITHVINYDPPEDDKGYVHRVGRTGRAGRTGTGVTLVLPDEAAELSRVANRLGHRDSFEEEGLKTAPAKVLYSTHRGGKSAFSKPGGRRRV
jgi:ATP-dependent RNA helicase DeaD/ATP-dependent RNA helicase RhlE